MKIILTIPQKHKWLKRQFKQYDNPIYWQSPGAWFLIYTRGGVQTTHVLNSNKVTQKRKPEKLGGYETMLTKHVCERTCPHFMYHSFGINKDMEIVIDGRKVDRVYEQHVCKLALKDIRDSDFEPPQNCPYILEHVINV